jgi:catechol 2,3-dioxygenase-like lactoylglutathione lyase family enzyme
MDSIESSAASTSRTRADTQQRRRIVARMITAAHATIYAEEAEAARAFFSDVLGFRSVDAGDGWLIFALPPAEAAFHPAPGPDVGKHEFFLMCDDIQRTVNDLQNKGVEFVAPISDEGWGLLTRLRIPGAGEIGVYQPKHPSPVAEPAR